jgi:DNA-binding CsgD family transcriptional regulator
LPAPQPPPHAVSPPRLEALVENVPGNVYRRVRRPDGTYYFAFLSRGLFRHFGIDNERLLAEESLRFDWIHPDDQDRFRSDLELSATMLSLLDHRIRIVGREGHIYWARGIARPERWPDGSVVWDGLVIDVTREVEAEAALRITKDDAERAHQRTAAIIAEVASRLRPPILELQTLMEAQDATAGIASAIRKSIDECLDALRLVDGAETSPSGNRREAAQTRRVEALGAAGLTVRQREVMRLLGLAKSNKEIAQHLGISPGTVRLHVAAVLKAMRARNRKEFVSAGG